MADLYERGARYYDGAYGSKHDLVDQAFYVELARGQGGRVLELACGTGRIVVPSARAGATIDGLDGSPAMLAVLRDKLAAEPDEVQRRVTAHRADMREFELPERYGLITAPFRGMQHMYTLDDQLAALGRARDHLAPGGRLVFDVFYPSDKVLAGVGDEHFDLEWRDGDLTVRRAFIKDEVDKIGQRFRGRFIFRSYRDGELVDTEEAGLEMSWYTHPQCLALFRLAGLRLVAAWGGFDRAPLDNDSREMIFELERG